MNAFAYMRCSGQGQVDGDTWERQEAAIKTYASSQGHDIQTWFRDEGVSGKTELLGRDGMTACIKQCHHHGITCVIVESADRLARDLIVAELLIREFQKAGVTIWSASGGLNLTEGNDGNPTALLIRQILGVISAFERNTTVLKLRGARQRIKARGERCEGKKPYGHHPKYPNEQNVIQWIWRFRDGGRTFSKIALELNDLGYKTRSGNKWHPNTVSKILRREALQTLKQKSSPNLPSANPNSL